MESSVFFGKSCHTLHGVSRIWMRYTMSVYRAIHCRAENLRKTNSRHRHQPQWESHSTTSPRSLKMIILEEKSCLHLPNTTILKRWGFIALVTRQRIIDLMSQYTVYLYCVCMTCCCWCTSREYGANCTSHTRIQWSTCITALY